MLNELVKIMKKVSQESLCKCHETQVYDEYKSEMLLFEPICPVTDVQNELSIISGFQSGVNEVLILLGCYAPTD